METFLALLYIARYIFCVPGNVKCSFTKPYVQVTHSSSLIYCMALKCCKGSSCQNAQRRNSNTPRTNGLHLCLSVTKDLLTGSSYTSVSLVFLFGIESSLQKYRSPSWCMTHLSAYYLLIYSFLKLIFIHIKQDYLHVDQKGVKEKRNTTSFSYLYTILKYPQYFNSEISEENINVDSPNLIEKIPWNVNFLCLPLNVLNKYTNLSPSLQPLA